MLQAASTYRFNPLVPKADNSEGQNLPIPLQVNPFLPTGQFIAPN